MVELSLQRNTFADSCHLQDQPRLLYLLVDYINAGHCVKSSVVLFVLKVTHVTFYYVINTSKEAGSAFIFIFYFHQAVSFLGMLSSISIQL